MVLFAKEDYEVTEADQSSMTRLMADCFTWLGLATAIGFEVSSAAQPKGEELTFRPKRRSAVNYCNPDFSQINLFSSGLLVYWPSVLSVTQITDCLYVYETNISHLTVP